MPPVPRQIVAALLAAALFCLPAAASLTLIGFGLRLRTADADLP